MLKNFEMLKAKGKLECDFCSEKNLQCLNPMHFCLLQQAVFITVEQPTLLHCYWPRHSESGRMRAGYNLWEAVQTLPNAASLLIVRHRGPLCPLGIHTVFTPSYAKPKNRNPADAQTWTRGQEFNFDNVNNSERKHLWDSRNFLQS